METKGRGAGVVGSESKRETAMTFATKTRIVRALTGRDREMGIPC